MAAAASGAVVLRPAADLAEAAVGFAVALAVVLAPAVAEPFAAVDLAAAAPPAAPPAAPAAAPPAAAGLALLPLPLCCSHFVLVAWSAFGDVYATHMACLHICAWLV